MKAVYYESFGGAVEMANVPDPVPGDGEVVIRVRASGLCRSDWHGWMGHDPDITLPHVPGHELAGEIDALGPGVRSFEVGDRVTVPFVGGCGRCPSCGLGQAQVCDHQFQPGFTHWGSFAERVLIRYAEQNLVRLPEDMDFVTAASLGCRFATAFRAVVDLGEVTAGQWVAVHGCGGVGLSAVMIAAAMGARVIAVDVRDQPLALARSVGAQATVRAGNGDVGERILEISDGGADLSMDALGHPQVLEQSLRSLKKQGRHVQVGLMNPDQTMARIPVDVMIARELSIVGSHGMQSWRYPQMLSMIGKGQLDPAMLVSETCELGQVPDRLVRMNEFDSSGVVVIDTF